MGERERVTQQAEDLVRRLLEENFHQKADNDTVKAVAAKVSKAVPAHWQEKHA